MRSVSELIPDLARWNNGAGIAPDAWIFIEGRADHALGFCTLFWPEFLEFEGYVLRAPLNMKRLRDWESAGRLTRKQIETAMNAYLLDTVFPQDQADDALKAAQCDKLASIMADMLNAKLTRDFPGRSFSTYALDGDEFGVSFHQM